MGEDSYVLMSSDAPVSSSSPPLPSLRACLACHCRCAKITAWSGTNPSSHFSGDESECFLRFLRRVRGWAQQRAWPPTDLVQFVRQQKTASLLLVLHNKNKSSSSELPWHVPRSRRVESTSAFLYLVSLVVA